MTYDSSARLLWLLLADTVHVHTPIVLLEEDSASSPTLWIKKLRPEGTGQAVE